MFNAEPIRFRWRWWSCTTGLTLSKHFPAERYCTISKMAVIHRIETYWDKLRIIKSNVEIFFAWFGQPPITEILFASHEGHIVVFYEIWFSLPLRNDAISNVLVLPNKGYNYETPADGLSH